MPRPKNNVLHNLFLTNGENEVYCNNDNCQNKTLTKHTGNLQRHLRIYHPKLYADYVQKKYASKPISKTLKTTVAVSDDELYLDDMPQRKMNTSESSESCSDQELEYFRPTEVCKIKLENVEELLTQCVDAPTTECVEDTSKSEFMDAPSSSTHVDASEESRRTNDPLLSSSIRILENSAKSIAKVSITEELFGCLAKKVNEANLTAQQINDIEHSVCLLVYSRLAKYKRECNTLVNN